MSSLVETVTALDPETKASRETIFAPGVHSAATIWYNDGVMIPMSQRAGFSRSSPATRFAAKPRASTDAAACRGRAAMRLPATAIGIWSITYNAENRPRDVFEPGQLWLCLGLE